MIKLRNRSKTEEVPDPTFQKLLSHPILNRQEERRFIGLAQRGSRTFRDVMIRCNMKLVFSIAKMYLGRTNSLSLSDLMGFGSIGLSRAVEGFDLKRGLKFSTYATWWVKQSIGRAITDLDRTIRIPNNYYTDYGKAIGLLQQKLGRSPTEFEIAFELGISVTDVKVRSKRILQSLDQAFDNDGDSADMVSTIEDKSVTANTSVFEESDRQNHLSKVLDELLCSLEPKEKMILIYRFGLDRGGEMRTLEQVGDLPDIGLTRERIRQLEHRAKQKALKYAIRKGISADFLNQ